MAGGKKGSKKPQAGQHGDAMQIDSQAGRPMHCHKCGKQGHKQRDCPQKQKQNGQHQNQNGHNANHGKQNSNKPTPPPCPFCKKPAYHTVEECFSNPDSPNYKGNGKGNGNANTNGNSGQQNGPKDSQYRYDGFLPRYYIEPYAGTKPYCTNCNKPGHGREVCTHTAAHLAASVMVCRICGAKGHTDSDCMHPEPIHCKVCFKRGHTAEACRHPTKIFHNAAHTAEESSQRFNWVVIASQQQVHAAAPIEDCNMPDVEEPAPVLAQQMVEASTILFPGQAKPLHKIPLNNNKPRAFKIGKPTKSTSNASTNGSSKTTSSFLSASTQEEIVNFFDFTPAQLSEFCHRFLEEKTSAAAKRVRAHIDRSARLYKKQNHNRTIQTSGCAISENNILSDRKLAEVQFAMAKGTQFIRDPKAMEALATRKRPVCHHCGKGGRIVDRHMRTPDYEVAAADGGAKILEIQDFEDWGVFVVFDCLCCNDGYAWVPRLPVEQPAPQAKQAPQAVPVVLVNGMVPVDTPPTPPRMDETNNWVISGAL